MGLIFFNNGNWNDNSRNKYFVPTKLINLTVL
jgi:hypothetical protein